MKFSAIFTAITTAASVQAQYYSSSLRRTSDGRWVRTDNGYYTYIWMYNQQCRGSAQYRIPSGYYRFRDVLQIGSAASLNN
ncbi:hypothetical protein CONCODRAFT_12133 [Conidiobolus coronatus NRRL 28638]|uniref:Uncharacterized protein n=1 Tax=Conidiobolus coronatus (strain ATCC 28846 / CBS 209.66 / NRRL 28638) TaxID=796925 RepID=A0A137NTN6_CONC2|nr:hypothetical protein CONCODRAFT_12133 [Conidiobolus coronatus NRRL 28638]|eukprot:KXN66099.1 hypothetical protein CONCODRAFT_12133 [Conidiobolus coronatus NRRL 28638]